MAENAANFTQTTQNKPSIFEIIAQKSLNETLSPAFEKVALFLSTNFPRKFGFLNFYGDESFTLFNGLLNYYYFKYYDSSFSESFYGLKRTLLSGKPLSDDKKNLCLLFIIITPYFKRKIEEKLQIYKIQHAEGNLNNNDSVSKLKRFIIHLHSATEIAWSLLTLNNYFQYMAGNVDYQLPLLKILNLKLVYSEEAPSLNFWGALFKGELHFADINAGLIRDAISSVLQTGAFFMQFLNAWNAHRPNYTISDFPKVEAPQCDNRAKTYQGKCPLCLQSWMIPTVLPISGYIFCFRCILKHLTETQKCPITNLPSKSLDLIRLYTN